ncbi:MAG: hypothetical protein Q9227_006577 [Pyrenula ochraceoflavens]
MKDIELDKIRAEDKADLKAKRRIFEDHFSPPTGRKPHSKTAVLLFYWKSSDIHVAPEFLGACDEDQMTFGPGPKSFTKFLIKALGELAVDGQGFDTRTLLSKVKNYEDFPRAELTPPLFHRDFRSTAHIWIEPVLSDEATGSRRLEAERMNDQSGDLATNPEWYDYSFVFNRRQENEDIKSFAKGLTEFTANHRSSHGLERITLEKKSPNLRLGWQYLALWGGKTRRKSVQGSRSGLPTPASITIQEFPAVGPSTDMIHDIPQDL